MRPFYERAHDYVDVGDFAYDVASALPGAPRETIPGLQSEVVLQDRLWRFSLPTNFGRANRERLASAPNVRLLLHANVLKLATNQPGTAVEGLRVTSLRGNEFVVRARRYVLATGGLETTRLLLVSNDANSSGLGNEHDLVGRFYSSHITGDLGQLAFVPPTRAVVWDYERASGGVYCKRHFRIADDAKQRLGLLNFRCHLSHPPFADPSHGSAVLSAAYLAKRRLRHRISPEFNKEMATSEFEQVRPHLRNIALGVPQLAHFGLQWLSTRTLRAREFPSVSLKSRSNTYTLHFDAEQAPNPESRVRLGDEVDALGTRRLRVEWRHSAADIESVSRCYALIVEELERTGVARAELPTEAVPDVVRETLGVGSHHLGTTRMSEHPSRGVVDSNCRVHTVKNLYVAGPSVFSTSSFANPVLTTTAFAVRLAEHLKALR
jgi:choline dehydrogenase-like flavoprotein